MQWTSGSTQISRQRLVGSRQCYSRLWETRISSQPQYRCDGHTRTGTSGLIGEASMIIVCMAVMIYTNYAERRQRDDCSYFQCNISAVERLTKSARSRDSSCCTHLHSSAHSYPSSSQTASGTRTLDRTLALLPRSASSCP